ncbi:hypothetical protein V6N11_018118 [Hibiscus sabdariffa]|uniref:Uncharacterized protein n=1 Tax=Hibiscus sabdariffa TaxID=183260 RepID=A0ABR2T6Y7_9ROSI
MGYNIGIRMINEFLAKSNVSRCVDFKETAEMIAKHRLGGKPGRGLCRASGYLPRALLVQHFKRSHKRSSGDGGKSPGSVICLEETMHMSCR